MFKGLKLLRQHGHDVLVFHVLDDDELDFPFNGPTRFEGLELDEHLNCNPRALREGYLRSAATRFWTKSAAAARRTASTTPWCAPASRWTRRWRRS